MEVPDATRTIKIYSKAPKLSEQEKTEKVSILIHDNGIRKTITCPTTGVRVDYNRSTRKIPKGSSLAQSAAAAWAFGTHTPDSIAAYIERQFKECIRSS